MPRPAGAVSMGALNVGVEHLYRFLELLEELVGLLFLRAVGGRGHGAVGSQHGRKDLLHSVGGHGGLSVGCPWAVPRGVWEKSGRRSERDGGRVLVVLVVVGGGGVEGKLRLFVLHRLEAGSI